MNEKMKPLIYFILLSPLEGSKPIIFFKIVNSHCEEYISNVNNIPNHLEVSLASYFPDNIFQPYKKIRSST